MVALLLLLLLLLLYFIPLIPLCRVYCLGALFKLLRLLLLLLLLLINLENSVFCFVKFYVTVIPYFLFRILIMGHGAVIIILISLFFDLTVTFN
jgi:hypothetical protein